MMTFKEIPPSKIDYGENVRFEKDDEGKALEDSIDDNDIIQPIIVRPKGGRYEVVCGHRRFTALKNFGSQSIPCVVRDDIDDGSLTIIQVEENIHRRNMSADELVVAFEHIKEQNGIKTNEELAQVLHKTLSWVNNQYYAVKLARKLGVEEKDVKKLTAGQIIMMSQKKKREDTQVKMGRYEFNILGSKITVKCDDKDKVKELTDLLSKNIFEKIECHLNVIESDAKHMYGNAQQLCSEIISECENIKGLFRGIYEN